MFSIFGKKLVEETKYGNGTGREQLLNHLYEENGSYVRKLTGVTANTTFTVPAGFQIESIVIQNTTANAVTGGVRFGTTDGGAQVITAQAVGASAFLKVASASILLGVFSMSAAQILYIQAVTAWNSANLNIYIKLSKVDGAYT